MRLFRSPTGEHPTTAMLRHMERGRFAEAGSALADYRGGFLPPPHALWHLGRELFRHGATQQAKRALKLFVDLDHGHADRAQVLHDLARVHVALGETEEVLHDLARVHVALGETEEGFWSWQNRMRVLL